MHVTRRLGQAPPDGESRCPARLAQAAHSAHEARLLELARARAPLRRGLGAVAARLVEARGWERLGFARLADYARERTGLSARQLQDLACTGRRLAALPRVEAAFLGGALPWTKARLVARVATAEDETAWLALARRLPAGALEREVRAVDRGALEAGALGALDAGGARGDPGGLDPDPEGDGARYEGVVLRCTPRVRGKLHRARQVARRVAGEALPVWACMEAVAAEAISALGIDVADDAEPAAEPKRPG